MQLIMQKKGAAATGFGPVSATAPDCPALARVAANATRAEGDASHSEEKEGQKPAGMGFSLGPGGVHAERGEVGEVHARNMQPLYTERLILALLLLLPKDARARAHRLLLAAAAHIRGGRGFGPARTQTSAISLSNIAKSVGVHE